MSFVSKAIQSLISKTSQNCSECCKPGWVMCCCRLPGLRVYASFKRLLQHFNTGRLMASQDTATVHAYCLIFGSAQKRCGWRHKCDCNMVQQEEQGPVCTLFLPRFARSPWRKLGKHAYSSVSSNCLSVRELRSWSCIRPELGRSIWQAVLRGLRPGF